MWASRLKPDLDASPFFHRDSPHDDVPNCPVIACVGPRRGTALHVISPDCQSRQWLRRNSCRPCYNRCMDSSATLTEADILSEIVAPGEPTLNQQFASAVLAVRFTDGATDRIRDLLQKNNAGTLSPAEKSNLDKYLRVGQFLDLMQAKARLSLQPARSAS